MCKAVIVIAAKAQCTKYLLRVCILINQAVFRFIYFIILRLELNRTD